MGHLCVDEAYVYTACKLFYHPQTIILLERRVVNEDIEDVIRGHGYVSTLIMKSS